MAEFNTIHVVPEPVSQLNDSKSGDDFDTFFITANDISPHILPS